MKNTYNFLIVMAIMIFVIGCSCGKFVDFAQKDTPANKTTDKTTPSSDGNYQPEDHSDDVSTGIPDCDKVINTINEEIAKESQKDDNWVGRATRNFFFNQVKKAVKSSIEENTKNANSSQDKDKIAESCRDYQKKIEMELTRDSEKK